MFTTFKVGSCHAAINSRPFRVVTCRSWLAITDVASQVACHAVVALSTKLQQPATTAVFTIGVSNTNIRSAATAVSWPTGSHTSAASILIEAKKKKVNLTCINHIMRIVARRHVYNVPFVLLISLSLCITVTLFFLLLLFFISSPRFLSFHFLFPLLILSLMYPFVFVRRAFNPRRQNYLYIWNAPLGPFLILRHRLWCRRERVEG